MGDGTGIAWADATWNVLTGCASVSPGCDNCYSERLTAGRLRHQPAYEGLTEGGKWTGHVRALPERLDLPLRWTRPRRIFVTAMSDLFHPEVDDLFLAEVWAVMGLASQHQFQILTKRPKAMAGLLADLEGEFRYKVSLVRKRRDADTRPPPWPYPNVWLGTSVESQRYAFRVRHLLETPAAVRFVSAEPLLGPLDLTAALRSWREGPEAEMIYGDSPVVGGTPHRPHFAKPHIGWVIAGSESGPGARPMDEDWVRGLRDQCQAAGVAFFFKQRLDSRGRKVETPELDGRQWTEYPA